MDLLYIQNIEDLTAIEFDEYKLSLTMHCRPFLENRGPGYISAIPSAIPTVILNLLRLARFALLNPNTKAYLHLMNS